jgi:hypothetical protein
MSEDTTGETGINNSPFFPPQGTLFITRLTSPRRSHAPNPILSAKFPFFPVDLAHLRSDEVAEASLELAEVMERGLAVRHQVSLRERLDLK